VARVERSVGEVGQSMVRAAEGGVLVFKPVLTKSVGGHS
jgi:hypothetical protein